MNYNKKSIEDINVSGKRVLCRCDFNVPTKNGKITSDKRIVAAMPTIKYLVDHNAKVILCSHMGKPKGEVKPELSLQVVADRISELLGKPVVMAKDVVGEDAKAKAAALKDGDVMLLENTRFENGQDLAGKNNAEVSQMLRGQAGTSFKLKIERPNVKGGRTPMEFTIVRESIQNPAIPYTAVLDNNIGYIGLSTFSGNPSKEFKKAFLDLKKQGATSLVIDLRSNGGGLLDEAVEIANYFLPRGKVIVTTKGKIKQASNTYKTLREPLDLDIPIAVLVNRGKDYAYEILSGYLKDLDRAVIVGISTFG